MEVAVLVDRLIQKCYESKFINTLNCACDAITDLGVYCRIIVLIVGALRFAHGKFVSILKILGLKPREAKQIARYCSVSSQMGSQMLDGCI